MPTSTPTFHRNVPRNLLHILLPRPILVFRFTSQQICLFSSHFSSTFGMHVRPSITSHAFSLCAAPLSRSSSISTSFAPKQPTSSQKNLQSESHPALLPSFFASQHAYTHLRSIIYVSITRGGIYLAPKRRNLLGKRVTGAQKHAVRSEQYFIVVPIQETIIKSQNLFFFFFVEKVTLYFRVIGLPLFSVFSPPFPFVIHILIARYS
jgi:hypothetical protein